MPGKKQDPPNAQPPSGSSSYWPESAEKPALYSFQENLTFVDRDFNVIWSYRTGLKKPELPEHLQSERKCYSIFHGRSEICPDCNACEALSTGKPISSIRTDSYGNFIQISGIPVTATDGEFTGILYRTIDITAFKLANDTYGHAVGDQLLNAAAKVLKSTCRTEDVVARWGGDEFAILLHRTTREAAESVFDRIMETCIKVQIAKVPLSLAIGLAVKTTPNQNLNSVVIEAERLMYIHKAQQKPA